MPDRAKRGAVDRSNASDCDALAIAVPALFAKPVWTPSATLDLQYAGSAKTETISRHRAKIVAMRRSSFKLAAVNGFLAACAGSDPDIVASDALGTSTPTGDTAAKPTVSALAASAYTMPSDASATSTPASTSTAPTMASCEPSSPPAGYTECAAIEVIGGPPCELECWRERKGATKDRCCEAPMHGAIFGKAGLLVEADACQHVDPNCAHTSDPIKSAEANFRFYSDSSPREVLLVQGGCEMRAMGHGYVPPGVAAWTGCAVAKRFRWDGARFVIVP